MQSCTKSSLAAEKQDPNGQIVQSIVIEVKSFLGRSFVEELQRAIGQYTMYRNFLKRLHPAISVVLAVSEVAYDDYFQQKAVQTLMKDSNIELLVVNLEDEEIVKWIS